MFELLLARFDSDELLMLSIILIVGCGILLFAITRSISGVNFGKFSLKTRNTDLNEKVDAIQGSVTVKVDSFKDALDDWKVALDKRIESHHEDIIVLETKLDARDAQNSRDFDALDKKFDKVQKELTEHILQSKTANTLSTKTLETQSETLKELKEDVKSIVREMLKNHNK